MAAHHQATTQGDTRTLRIDGKFDFSMHRTFRELYEDAPSGIAHYVIDLARTDYMDSSALGMLLLREHVQGERSRVRIVNCNPEIRKILEIANFDKLFEIG